MKNFAPCFINFQCLCSSSFVKLAVLSRSIWCQLVLYFRFILLRLNPIFFQLFYFIFISFLGFLVLKGLNPRTHNDSYTPKDLDFLFTSVSASTVSSMSTIEMEVFSNTQLLILTILMFIGGEVFTSMIGLFVKQFKLKKTEDKVSFVNSDRYHSATDVSVNTIEQIVELGLVSTNDSDHLNFNFSPNTIVRAKSCESLIESYLKYYSVRFLGFVVLGYLLVINVLGVVLVQLYINLISSARDVLRNKGLKSFTFSVFTIVSTFASCGFIPTNENMVVFKKNSGLLLILIPQVLFGNTLFPSCLRFCIWVLGKFVKKEESKYLLNNSEEIAGYLHLLPSLHSLLLIPTVFGFIAIQFIMFCSMEWNLESLSGLNSYQKIIGSFFQSVNARHTGETIVDISIISQAILVLFIVMMYLPPYTSFLPIKDDEKKCLKSKREKTKKGKGKVVENLIFSQLTYLVMFIILVCITERSKLKEDPLNFNVLNITVEVISAYGNVGFTTGYSCKRQLNPNSQCVDKWYGFVGRWSNGGKVILIVVMLFGRLKKFNMNGGRAWILK